MRPRPRDGAARGTSTPLACGATRGEDRNRGRIADGIAAARAFVFVLIPSSLASTVCRDEIRQAGEPASDPLRCCGTSRVGAVTAAGCCVATISRPRSAGWRSGGSHGGAGEPGGVHPARRAASWASSTRLPSVRTVRYWLATTFRVWNVAARRRDRDPLNPRCRGASASVLTAARSPQPAATAPAVRLWNPILWSDDFETEAPPAASRRS
jgi:hypothetical protein